MSIVMKSKNCSSKAGSGQQALMDSPANPEDFLLTGVSDSA
jgi:hypothetical protein